MERCTRVKSVILLETQVSQECDTEDVQAELIRRPTLARAISLRVRLCDVDAVGE